MHPSKKAQTTARNPSWTAHASSAEPKARGQLSAASIGEGVVSAPRKATRLARSKPSEAALTHAPSGSIQRPPGGPLYPRTNLFAESISWMSSPVTAVDLQLILVERFLRPLSMSEEKPTSRPIFSIFRHQSELRTNVLRGSAGIASVLIALRISQRSPSSTRPHPKSHTQNFELAKRLGRVGEVIKNRFCRCPTEFTWVGLRSPGPEDPLWVFAF